MHNILPTVANLVKWGSPMRLYVCYAKRSTTIEYVLSACKVAFRQGQFTWCYSKVLINLVAMVDVARL